MQETEERSIVEHCIECHQDALATMEAMLIVRTGRTTDTIEVRAQWVNPLDGEICGCTIFANYKKWISVIQTIGSGAISSDERLTISPQTDGYYRLQFNVDEQVAWLYLSDEQIIRFRDALQGIHGGADRDPSPQPINPPRRYPPKGSPGSFINQHNNHPSFASSHFAN